MRISAHRHRHRHRPLISAMLLLVSLAPLLPVSTGPASAVSSTVTLGGVHVRLRTGTREVVTVNRRRGDHATVSFWTRSGARWHRRLTAHDGRIGYGGLVAANRRRQGTGATPLGTFGLPSAFGMHARNRAWRLPYRRATAGAYWVEDNRSAYYNRYRTKAQGGFRWWLKHGENTSERLRAYPRQYEWAIVTDFNAAQVRHRGAGIFLHVNGSGATAGCVSAPRWFVRRLMARLAPAAVPVVAIGR